MARIEEQCDRYRTVLEKKEIPAYATIIPSRTTKGAVALHTRLSHAKNAINQTERSRPGGRHFLGGEIHELVNGEWRLLHRIEYGAQRLPWS